MKELSIEDKAKRYDEAIIRAKSLIGDTIIEESGQHIAEVIFPELKESEDERTRKEIILYLKSVISNKKFGDKSIESWVAWLEKQEQKPFDYESANIQQKDFAPKENTPRYSIGDVLCDKSCTTLNRESQPNFEIIDIWNGMYICDKCAFPISQQDEYELVAKKIEQKPIDKIQLGKKYKCIASPRYTTFMIGKIYKPEDKFLCSLMNFCSDCFKPIEDGEQK